MDEREQGQRNAGRIVYELEAVGVLALIVGAASMFMLDSPSRWYALAAFFLVAAVAFGFLANAVLRR